MEPLLTPSAPSLTRVLVVDDHPTFRHGIMRVLQEEGGFEICAEAGNSGEALDAARRHAPHLALVDIAIPGVNGVELIKALRAEHPGLRMLTLSMHDEMLYAARAIRAGALGYVNKDSPYEMIAEAIRRVSEGRLFLSPALSQTLLKKAILNLDPDRHPDFELLSEREIEILTLYGKGKNTHEVCAETGIGIKTVETYRTRIKDKLGLRDFDDLRRFAVDWVRSGQN